MSLKYWVDQKNKSVLPPGVLLALSICIYQVPSTVFAVNWQTDYLDGFKSFGAKETTQLAFSSVFLISFNQVTTVKQSKELHLVGNVMIFWYFSVDLQEFINKDYDKGLRPIASQMIQNC